jgi:hypothetical protein
VDKNYQEYVKNWGKRVNSGEVSEPVWTEQQKKYNEAVAEALRLDVEG